MHVCSCVRFCSYIREEMSEKTESKKAAGEDSELCLVGEQREGKIERERRLESHTIVGLYLY